MSKSLLLFWVSSDVRSTMSAELADKVQDLNVGDDSPKFKPHPEVIDAMGISF